MNFINDLESTEVRIELKYCERCGGLFFRAHETSLVYCNSCHVRQTQWEAPAPLPRHAGRADRRSPRIPILRGAAAERRVSIGTLRGIASLEVHAC